jgi:hypothetical protein
MQLSISWDRSGSLVFPDSCVLADGAGECAPLYLRTSAIPYGIASPGAAGTCLTATISAPNQTPPAMECSGQLTLSTSVHYSNWSYCFGMAKHMSLTIVVPESVCMLFLYCEDNRNTAKEVLCWQLSIVHFILPTMKNFSCSFPSWTKFAVGF